MKKSLFGIFILSLFLLGGCGIIQSPNTNESTISGLNLKICQLESGINDLSLQNQKLIEENNILSGKVQELLNAKETNDDFFPIDSKITGIKYFIDKSNQNYLLFTPDGIIYFGDNVGYKKIGMYETGLSHVFNEMQEYKEVDGKEIIEYAQSNVTILNKDIVQVFVLGWDGIRNYYLVDIKNKTLISTYAVCLESVCWIGNNRLEGKYDEKSCVLNKIVFEDSKNSQELIFDIKSNCQPVWSAFSDNYYKVNFESYNNEKRQIIFGLVLSGVEKRFFGYDTNNKQFFKK